MPLEEELLKIRECPFCKIARKETQAYIVAESLHSIAFLDINPANIGHVIVIPKKHYKSLEEIPEEELVDLIKMLKEVVKKVKKLKVNVGEEEFEPLAITILSGEGKELEYQQIEHFAFHVIPRTPNDNIYIAWRPVFDMGELLLKPQLQVLMEEVRKKLAEA